MYTIHRSIPSSKPWKPLLGWIIAAGIAVAAYIFLSKYISTELLHKAVLPEVMADSVQFIHILLATAILFCIILGVELSSSRLFGNPYGRVLQQEFAAFAQLYRMPVVTNPHTGVSHKQLFLLAFFLPLGIVLWAVPKILVRLELNLQITRYIALGAFCIYIISFIILFLRLLLRKRTQQSHALLNPLFQTLHGKDRATLLNIKELSEIYNAPLREFKIHLDGLFRGRSLTVRHLTPSPSQTSELSLMFFRPSSFNHVVIAERNSSWKKLSGKDVNDCFAQRFEVVGIDPQSIPVRLKEKLLNEKQNVWLTITKQYVVVHNKNSDLLPFYSVEGMLVWIDSCRHIAEICEST